MRVLGVKLVGRACACCRVGHGPLGLGGSGSHYREVVMEGREIKESAGGGVGVLVSQILASSMSSMSMGLLSVPGPSGRLLWRLRAVGRFVGDLPCGLGLP